MYEIYHEDCLEGMKRIPDGAVDMILTDLPYETTCLEWDVRLPFDLLWQVFVAKSKKNAAIVLFSQLPFMIDLINSNRQMFRYEIIWEKPLASGHLNCNRMPLKSHENILVFYQKVPTYNPQFTQGKPRNYIVPDGLKNKCYHGKNSFSAYYDGQKKYPRDVQKFNVVQGHEPRYHSTQKPVDLLEYLIRTYTNEGETVLDATMGSGSTGVAAINTGRNFIGFETEQKFFDIARKRIDEAIALKAQSLF